MHYDELIYKYAMKKDSDVAKKRTKQRMEKIEKFLPITIDQITKDFYNFLTEWEPKDLAMNRRKVFDETQDVETAEENMFSRKYGACTPLYVPTVQKTYFPIDADLFTRFVGDELSVVIDCYMAYCSADYETVKALHDSRRTMQPCAEGVEEA